MSDIRDQLHNLSKSLSLLSVDRKTFDKEKLNVLLDELNAINYRYSVIPDSSVVFSLIKTICLVVPTTESFLMSKSCKLICRLVKKHQIPPMTSLLVCKYLIKAITESNKTVLEDILEALYSILKVNGHYVSDLYEDLVGVNGLLFQLLEYNKSIGQHSLLRYIENPFYVELGALKCVQAITRDISQNIHPTNQLTQEHIDKCIQVSLFYLHRYRLKNQDEINFCETLICVCNTLIQIYSNNNEIDKNLSVIIGACRCWMVYGLEGCQDVQLQKVMPSQQLVPDVPQIQTNKGGKRMKLRKHRNAKPINNCRDHKTLDNISNNTILDNTSSNTNLDPPNGYKAANVSSSQLDNIPISQFTITSESDVSDWENNRQKKLLSVQSNTRLASLNLLAVIIRTSPKHLIFGYWWCLMGSDPVSVPYCSGLGRCIDKEKNVSVRTAALTALLSLLTSSRSYLSQAERCKRAMTSFTPFSVSLGNSLEEVHSLVCSVVAGGGGGGGGVPVLVGALKCAVACIQATPYHKLGGHLLTNLVSSSRKHLTHRDWTIQVAALIVMGCTLSVDPPVPEISQIFGASKTTQNEIAEKIPSDGKNEATLDDECSDQEFDEDCVISENLEDNVCLETEVIAVSSEDLEKMSWLLEICLRNLGWSFKNGFMEPSRLALIPIRLESLQVVSAIALKYFEEFLVPYFNIITRMVTSSMRDIVPSICLHATKCLSSLGDALQKLDFSISTLLVEDCVMFWSRMLRGPLTEVLQSDQNSAARAIACDCISSIAEPVFIKLPENLKILCATLLLGSSSDEDPLVKAAAVRALSVCIMYKDWREDPNLVSDCGESVLRVLSDASPAAKIKATWALANITDALLLNIDNPEAEPIDDNLLVRLLEESISTSKDNDKIKMSAMRAIGNILLLLGEDDLKNTQLQTLAMSGMERLVFCVSNGNNMKVRWNACHALGKTMKNEILFTKFKNWQQNVFVNLYELMEKCRNLKVRSHAAIALRSPNKRHLYGDSFFGVWKAVLCAMDNTNHTQDFTEYKHKDQLVEQLCVTLSHLACLLNVEDLSDIVEVTNFLWDSASHLLREVAQRTEPQGETCSRLLDAAKYVTTQLTSHTDNQRECLNILQNLFVWETSN